MNEALRRLIGGPEKPDVDALKNRILAARSGPALSREAVIAACAKLSDALNAPEYAALLAAMGMPKERAEHELRLARTMLSAEYLRARIKAELGETEDVAFTPVGEAFSVRQGWRPLGTLLHISAGNVDALPAFSVIEGLLTGNVNLLKLPREDNGLSAAALELLCEIEPSIRPFVEIFDVPSEDVETLQALAALADAVVVWGGEEAIRAVRRMVSPDTRIVEWGHKLSFAYFSGEPSDDALRSAAINICATEQLYCSSCQGIFVDTDDFETVCRFAERFAAILSEVSAETPRFGGERVTAQKTLEVYTEQLEALRDPSAKRVFRAEGASVIAYSDSALAASRQFRCPWVKPLPKERLLETLLPYKNLLQTVFLSCPDESREALTALLLRTGAVRITDGRRMSEEYCALPHDGDYPLRRYLKRISVEI